MTPERKAALGGPVASARARAGGWTAEALDTPRWKGGIAVVSPHLDDAVFSLGASMRAAVRRGASVTVITVCTGDPASRAPAGQANRAMGFATTGAAAQARRAEDARACHALDVRPVWLGFPDDPNEPAPPDGEMARVLGRELARYDAVLIPGFPLVHPDHVRISRIVLEVLGAGRALGLYVEQPYASWNAVARRRRARRSRGSGLTTLGVRVSPSPRWTRCAGRPDDWVAKWRAISEYPSQLRVLHRLPRLRIMLYEAARGGEGVMWCRIAGPQMPAG
jgi:LmbE family N-acetylglucosaminyl deacetylase